MKDMYNRNKKPSGIIIILLLIILAIIGVFILNIGVFDGLFLFELRHPKIAKSLSIQSSYQIYVNDSEQDTKNRMVLDINRNVYDPPITMMINSDGTITLNGFDEENDHYFAITPSRFKLQNGNYNISIHFSDSAKGVYLYATGQSTFGEKTLFGTSNYKNFTVGNDGISYYTFGIAVPKGTTIDNLTISVVLTKGKQEGVVPYSMPVFSGNTGYDEIQKVLLFYISKNDFSTLSDNDTVLWKKRLRTYFNDDFSWVSVVFDGGTGVQFLNPDCFIEGTIDSWGRVNKY